MTRGEMLDEMIRIYGFEHEVVIQFARVIESPYISDRALEVILNAHKDFPVWVDEEDE